MVDVLVVTEWLEDGVGEAGDEQVLARLLAEVVVDPEDRSLAERLEDLGVEFRGRGQVPAEGLFDDDAVALAAAGDHPRPAQVLDDGDEVVRRRGAVEEAVAGRAELLVDALQLPLESREGRLVVEVAADIAEPLGESLPDRVGGLSGARVGVDRGSHLAAELFVRQGAPGPSPYGQVGGQESL